MPYRALIGAKKQIRICSINIMAPRVEAASFMTGFCRHMNKFLHSANVLKIIGKRNLSESISGYRHRCGSVLDTIIAKTMPMAVPI
jgi:hypothetical protein